MICFKNTTDNLLLTSTKTLAREERELTLKILHHLREIERRYLFAQLGFSSLYEYAIRELGYTEASAHRRISSMRLLKIMPELEEKIESGVLPLSTLAQAQTFFRQEKIQDEATKREVLSVLEGKSSRQVQRELVTRSSEPEKLIPEKVRAVSDTHHQLNIVIDDEMLKQIEELKLLFSSSQPGISMKDILKFGLNAALEKKRVKAPKVKTAVVVLNKKSIGAVAPIEPVEEPAMEIMAMPTPTTELVQADSINRNPKPTKSRYIPVEVRRAIWARDQGRCTYSDPHTENCCGSQSGLELDHILPFAAGGDHSLDNLRLRCRVHNTLAAMEFYGVAKMSRHVSAIRQ